jgi:hypothetical protein
VAPRRGYTWRSYGAWGSKLASWYRRGAPTELFLLCWYILLQTFRPSGAIHGAPTELFLLCWYILLQTFRPSGAIHGAPTDLEWLRRSLMSVAGSPHRTPAPAGRHVCSRKGTSKHYQPRRGDMSVAGKMNIPYIFIMQPF